MTIPSTMHFNINEDFEPSLQTKKFCLYASKTKEEIITGEKKLYGLFRDDNYWWHVFFFCVILIFEGVATYFCYEQGVAIATILFTIVIDLAIAIIAHFFQKDICELSNRLRAAHDKDNPKEIEGRLQNQKMWQRVCYAIIMVSAFFKVYWYLEAVSFILDANAILIIVMYTLGGVLHITSTGYALFMTRYILMWRSDYKKYINSHKKVNAFDVNTPYKQYIETALTLVKCEGKTYKLSYIDKPEEGEKQGYYIICNGVLLDTDLRDIVQRQTEEARKTVLKAGIACQLNILYSAPNKKAANTH